MKTVRLDEILLRSELVTEDQIKQALMRQRSRGGKLGSHLLYYRFISEQQLVDALAEQFSIDGVQLGERNIADDVISKIPVELVEEYMVFPFKFEPETNTLSVAIADPDDSIAISAVKRFARVSKVIAHVAPEIILRNLIVSHYHGRVRELSMDQIVSLPNLFEEEVSSRETKQKEDSAFSKPGSVPQQPLRKVLMVTGQVFLRNFLPSIFEREGLELIVVSGPEQTAAALSECFYERVVVSEDAEEMFNKVFAGVAANSPLPDISVFSTITSALMDSPVPYGRMFSSMLRSVQLLADYRCSALSWQPPYALISNDIREIGRLLGLRGIAVDGLQLAAHLLVPFEKTSEKMLGTEEETSASTGEVISTHSDSDPFQNLNDSIRLAESMNFSWNIPACIESFAGLLDGTGSLVDLDLFDDTGFAAQILALAWYRHYTFRNVRSSSNSSEADFDEIKSGLRNQAGRLASSSVVESYIVVLERIFKQHAFGVGKNIFVVGNVRNLLANFVNELKRHGFRTVEIPDIAEVRYLYDRQHPDAVLVNYDSSPALALELGRLVMQDRMGAGVAMFALTASADPSLIMNLIESGFNDVFAPPFNNDVIVARISKTLATSLIKTSQKDQSASASRRGFSATFNELSFLDLIQALAGGLKNVCICLERDTGETADIYLREGRMVHAVCGNTTGAEAVYRVIAWRDDGSFVIEPVTDFPPDNISAPNDSILLEGCRILDESEG